MLAPRCSPDSTKRRLRKTDLPKLAHRAPARYPCSHDHRARPCDQAAPHPGDGSRAPENRLWGSEARPPSPSQPLAPARRWCVGENAASYDPWRRVPHLPQKERPCPASGVVTVGGALDYVTPIGGGSLGGGFAVDNWLDTELYGNAAGGAGVNIGAGIEVGYYPGGQQSLIGPFTEFEANFIVVDIGVVVNGEGFQGVNVTFGPQAPGGSVTVGSGGVTNLDPQCVRRQ